MGVAVPLGVVDGETTRVGVRVAVTNSTMVTGAGAAGLLLLAGQPWRQRAAKARKHVRERKCIFTASSLGSVRFFRKSDAGVRG